MDLSFLNTTQGFLLAAAVVVLACVAFFNVKQWEVSWKQWAIDTANAMSKAGLVHLPKVLNALAVGDLAGAFKEIKALKDIFTDPKQLAAEFATVFQMLLQAAFSDPTQAKNIQQMANDAVAAFASGNPIAAAPQLALDAQNVFAGSPFAGISAPPSFIAAMLPHLPAIGSDPALQQFVGTLQNLGLGNLIPQVLAGHAVAKATAPAASAAPKMTPASAAPSSSGAPAAAAPATASALAA